MSRWRATKASRVLASLQRIGWETKREAKGSHKVLRRDGFADFVWAFHDRDEIGPRQPLHLPGILASGPPDRLVDVVDGGALPRDRERRLDDSSEGYRPTPACDGESPRGASARPSRVGRHFLVVWFVLDHNRRRVIHFNVTASPTARWAIQQLRETFPSDTALPFLVYDRDSIFSAEVTAAIQRLGTEPVRTAYRSLAVAACGRSRLRSPGDWS